VGVTARKLVLASTDDARASLSAFRQRFEPERRYDHFGSRVLAVRR